MTLRPAPRAAVCRCNVPALTCSIPAEKRSRTGRRVRARAARGQAPPSARAALTGTAPRLIPPNNSPPHPSHWQLVRPASLRATAPAPAPPPYAWPTATRHPLDSSSHHQQPLPVPAPPPVFHSHSEMHAAAAGDAACCRLHAHGRCYESGAWHRDALLHPTLSQASSSPPAGAVLQSRGARGCLQGGTAHWSFHASKVHWGGNGCAVTGGCNCC
jgi:hypothetical protein